MKNDMFSCPHICLLFGGCGLSTGVLLQRARGPKRPSTMTALKRNMTSVTHCIDSQNIDIVESTEFNPSTILLLTADALEDPRIFVQGLFWKSLPSLSYVYSFAFSSPPLNFIQASFRRKAGYCSRPCISVHELRMQYHYLPVHRKPAPPDSCSLPGDNPCYSLRLTFSTVTPGFLEPELLLIGSLLSENFPQVLYLLAYPREQLSEEAVPHLPVNMAQTSSHNHTTTHHSFLFYFTYK